MSKKKKKKKKAVAKKRAQAKVKKKKKAKSTNSISNVQYIERPAISEIEAPSGFRAVSASQGMIEFAQPVMDFVERGVVKDPNDAFQLVIPIWNYSLSQNNCDIKPSKTNIIKQIRNTLKLNDKESAEFFDMMIQRKEYLFPDNIQPDNPMTMFIRQEEHNVISKFNYDSLNLSEEPYLPDKEDEKLIQLFNQLDNYISEGVEYDEWEDHYFSMEEKCKKCYKKWLIFKGVEEYSKDFPFYIEIYLNFIYRYMHKDDINLKTVLPVYIEEFFVDHILRKVIIEPQEYIMWPPALKLFYNFLYEIGYLNRPEKIIKLVDGIEPQFINILRDRES
ncbi:MAG: hypothetical protein R6V04_02755 [bacterium]